MTRVARYILRMTLHCIYISELRLTHVTSVRTIDVDVGYEPNKD